MRSCLALLNMLIVQEKSVGNTNKALPDKDEEHMVALPTRIHSWNTCHSRGQEFCSGRSTEDKQFLIFSLSLCCAFGNDETNQQVVVIRNPLSPVHLSINIACLGHFDLAARYK